MRRKPLEVLATFSVFLTITFAAVVVFAPVSLSDAKTHKASHGKAYVASIASEDAVGIKVVPTNDQKTFKGNHSIAYSNTCPYGFSISMASSSENTGMVAEIRGKTETIPSVSEVVSTLLDNTWGYSTDGGKTYNPIPSSKSPVTLVSLASEVKEANVDVIFAVKTNNKIKAGNYSGDVVYTVSAKPACLEYMLKWDLKGGLSSQTGLYNDTYASFGDLFNLKTYALTRTGYDFKGWNNGKQTFTGAETSVDINPDNLQSITMTAQWQPTKYTISYNLDGGSAASNPANYTIETDSFKLSAPTKEGYNFIGWTGSNGTTPATDVTIAKGSTGNKNYTANWEEAASRYNISYDLNGGTLATPNPSSYTTKDTELVLNAPTKEGRTFEGFVCVDAEGFDGHTDASNNVMDISGGDDSVPLYLRSKAPNGDLLCVAYYKPNTTKKSFSFSGKAVSYTVPEDGVYRIIANGGDGHPNVNNTGNVGRGGSVTYENVYLKAGLVLYVSVGEGGYAPSPITKLGWNGGGISSGTLTASDDHYSTGGGATHIATKSTSSGLLSALSSSKETIVVVAGGGGGGATGTAHDTEGYNGGNGCAGPFSDIFGKSPCGANGVDKNGTVKNPCYNQGSGGGYYGGQMYYGGGACYIKSPYSDTALYKPKSKGKETLPVKMVPEDGCLYEGDTFTCNQNSNIGSRTRWHDRAMSGEGFVLSKRSGNIGNGSASIEFKDVAVDYDDLINRVSN